MHGLNCQVWPTESETRTVVHGINRRVWPSQSGPWSAWYQPPNMANKKWTMEYSP